MRVRVAVAALVCASALAGVASSPAAATPLLPDLTQATPYDLGVATDGKRYHLGFGSVVYNYGDGPLRIVGTRESADDPTMTAAQYIDESGSDDQTQRQAIGQLRYVDAITHRHWHYLKFDTYSLRRPDGSLARPDQKTGFCLGDRVGAPSPTPIPGMQPYAEYGGNCGYDSPGLMRVDEGIAVGYGDDYGPQLEGQFIDITHVPAGRYVLVHRVNADGALAEKTLDNNAASVLIDLRYKGKVPRVTQVARCPSSATCPVAPALSRGRAVRFAREGFRRAFRENATGVSCADPVDGAASCTGTLRSGVGTVQVRYSVAGGRVYWTYAATKPGSVRPKRGRVGVSLGTKHRVPVKRAPMFAPRGSTAAAKRVGYCPLIGRG
jgi:hypothetical protein